ncbi:MAG: ComF family protein [Candidatus Gorgyraea atricola]|nr:ComF family protein [Candidatus Gorgyraea atricola]
MISSIINLFFPSSCQVCGEKTRPPDENICASCMKKIKKRLPPFCVKCGKKLSGGPEMKELCNDCKEDTLYFDKALSVFHYDGAIKKLVHDFKYKKITSPVKEFTRSTIDFMKEHGMAKDLDLVLSVPMHRSRLFKREINPSRVLAENIAKIMHVQYSDGVLKKTINTPPQSSLPRNERIKNIKKSFSLQKNKITHIKDKNMLLVDDLFTTGSTVNECARILKEAGSRQVEIITLARGDKAI